MKIPRIVLYIGILVLFFGFIFGLKIGRVDNLYLTRGRTCTKCNVILFIADPLPADRLPCYGFTRNTMPNLCRFASDHLLFDNVYSHASWTMPSIMSIVTSRYPYTHKMQVSLQDVLSPQIKTIAEVFKASGYHTVYVGEITDPHVPFVMGLSRGFDEIIEYTNPEDWIVALDKIHTQFDGKPTFLFIHSFNTHIYSFPPASYTFRFDPLFKKPLSLDNPQFSEKVWKSMESYLQVYKNDVPQNELKKIVQATSFSEAQKYFYQLPQGLQNGIFDWDLVTVSAENKLPYQRYLRNVHDENVYKFDQQLNKFLIEFEHKFVNNTLLFFTSAHGTEFYEHDAFLHGGNLYRNVTHVPLIVSVPAIKSRRIVDLIQSIDIYPTILSLVGIKIPGPSQGKNVAPRIFGAKFGPHNNYAYGQLGPIMRLLSIRDLTWSYYVNLSDGTLAEELYKLDEDPNELRNVITQYTEVAQKMKTNLRQFNDNKFK